MWQTTTVTGPTIRVRIDDTVINIEHVITAKITKESKDSWKLAFEFVNGNKAEFLYGSYEAARTAMNNSFGFKAAS